MRLAGDVVILIETECIFQFNDITDTATFSHRYSFLCLRDITCAFIPVIEFHFHVLGFYFMLINQFQLSIDYVSYQLHNILFSVL